MFRPWLKVLPLLLLIGSSILLLEGSPILTQSVRVGGRLPFGTLVAWVGIIMVPCSILVGIRLIRKPISPVYRFYNRAFLGLTLFSFLWGGISYLLAGNWAFTFSESEKFRGSEQAGSVFMYYTGILISLTLLLFLAFGIHHLYIQIKKK